MDCALRALALETARHVLGPERRSLSRVENALRFAVDDCPLPKLSRGARRGAPPPHAADVLRTRSGIRVSAARGSDTDGDGSSASPFATLRHAIRVLRKKQGSASAVPPRIELAGGETFYLAQTLVLSAQDSGLVIETEPGAAPATISGGIKMELAMRPLDTAEERAWFGANAPHVLKAELPVNATVSFTTLFDATQPADAGARATRSGSPKGALDQERLPWARAPNHVRGAEVDLQPLGYAFTRDGGRGFEDWPDAAKDVTRCTSVEHPRRNSTIYPVWGRDDDPRGAWQCFHRGGSAVRFGDNRSFWNGTVRTGFRWNVFKSAQYPHAFDARRWSADGVAGAVAHVFQTSGWGNWQFRVRAVNATGSGAAAGSSAASYAAQVAFDRSANDGAGMGGWQEGHGGPMVADQPFFIEGVREALDSPGEWWVDRATRTLYVWPNSTASAAVRTLVAPTEQTLVRIQGTNAVPVSNVTVRNIIFAHSAPTYFEPYVVPSPGDWSVHRGGAVYVRDARGVALVNCTLARLGGNGVALDGEVFGAQIVGNDMLRIGGSAIVIVGRVAGANSAAAEGVAEFASHTRISSNLVDGVGVIGKQSAAIFQANALATTIEGNVLFNGPRAGINFNDGFGGGDTVTRNVLFNWVRETRDHGPINTWDRAMYYNSSSANSTTMRWRHVTRNFIMTSLDRDRDTAGLFPAVDNDDGSRFYYVADNVVAYGGMKNFLGVDKTWSANLIVYPDRMWGDPCAMLWGGARNAFVNNTCVLGRPTLPSLPDASQAIGLDGGTGMDPCKLDFANATLRATTAFLASNAYYTQGGRYAITCGNRTTNASRGESHNWTLADLQRGGWELNSAVRPLSDIDPQRLAEMGRAMLLQ